MSLLKISALSLGLAFSLTLAGSVSGAEEAKKKDPKEMKADEAEAAGLCPVCKNEFKPVYHFEYKGKDYHFKTRNCQKEFAADPTKFGAVGKDWKPDDDKKKPRQVTSWSSRFSVSCQNPHHAKP